jgi:16S rRNA (cytosine1402-N4)-methyltransferase
MPDHAPVMPQETIALLAPRAGQTLLDGTAGLGGHAALIAAAVPLAHVFLCDLDAGNLARAEARVRSVAPKTRVTALHGSFAAAPQRLNELGARADMLLADLGFASSQVDDAERGLSFMRDGPLDMRLDRSRGPTAADLIATLPEAELARIIADYGEERLARRVAQRIVAERRATAAAGGIRRTAQLAEIVRAVVPRVPGPDGSRGIDPATRTFQALRIAVNDELGHLSALLDALEPGRVERWLSPAARAAVITFHSLEDRPVKRAFGALVRAGHARDLSNGTVTATEREVETNPRARSAKLRAVEFSGHARP